ncbi:MAG: hypothetical protein DWQ02_06010 [Bacteroidetes bacterium]|nr:MAG: hypothetical protein DWQ02_06010 [Bacteroidota bacterium]
MEKSLIFKDNDSHIFLSISIMEEGKKRGLSFGRILLIIIVLILGMLVMQKMGVNIVKTSEKSEVTDDPHPGY